MVALMSSEDKTAAIKPFRLVKFFSYTTLLVFLLFTPLLAVLISKNANNVLLSRSEEYALVFASNINSQVYDRFVVPSVLRFGSLAPQHPGQQKRLDLIVKDITHGMKVESVSILDQQNDTVAYSTFSERIGLKGEGGQEYLEAREGGSSSRLIRDGSILNLLPGAKPAVFKLISYIPFRSEKNSAKIMGVIEIVQDMSDDYHEMIKLEGGITLIATLAMFLLFVVLRLIVAKADQQIDARARERQILEEKLLRNEQLVTLGKMVASVSHEIKNPLGIVRSTAEMLRKRLGGASDANDRLLLIIIEETGRLDRIVREFLDFARPRKMQLQSVSISEIVTDAVNFVEPELNQRGIRKRLTLSDRVKPLMVDRELLYRAMLNILLNSIYAMQEEGGELAVVVRPVELGREGVVVEISDTGPGIPEDRRDQIFKPFYSDKVRGSGLGLAIVKKIIEDHRGAIELISPPGTGATFRITLG
ncbi:MAG: two-component sensor histidine kinase [Proteobacteria bacterium]|nr:two-component sensor histidine kinase [Pseudomonadota bacterium]MBU1686315.1 two-component sensor histidine kinase [Pseudomonadota bacterium]